MAISQKRYVDITSGVGGAAAATQRELIARLLTTNPLAPFGSVMEFTSLDNVGAHFGTTSTEYLWSANYFGYISKDIVMPGKISFARYAPEALAPQLISTITPSPATSWTTISDGSMILTIGGEAITLSNMDFSDVSSLSDVAGIVQSAVQASGGGSMFATATVAYNETYAGFVFTGATTGAATINYATTASSGTDISGLIGWNAASLPVLSQGAAAETAAEAIARIAALSDNFGSFAFIETLDTEDVGAVAAWNNSAEQNLKFMYSVPVTSVNYTEIQTAVAGMNGTALTLTAAGEYAEYMPCAIMAATDYTRTNATRNYMFQQFPGATALVTTDALADVYDNLQINYYGATQSAGKQLAFYQRGVLQGSVEDMGVYANEIWLKDSFLTAFFNLLLALNKIPANQDGEAMVRAAMMDTISQALNNGTILPSKTFTTAQKAYIDQLTGRENSWLDVFNNGYTLDITVTTVTENGSTMYQISYVLIYSKGDSIKKVEGTHVLI